MRLSWNEIRSRASKFAREWANASYEKGETQSFYDEFFNVFGVRRRTVARYEEHISKIDESVRYYIDLFWPGTLIIEQKSQGRDLGQAYQQAAGYFDILPEQERPRYILVSDFQTFVLRDLDERTEIEFTLEELPNHVESFGFILDTQTRIFREQDPVNVKAAELVGKLYDKLYKSGYKSQDLEQFLVRIVFCLFADDTGIFAPRNIFQKLIEERTNEDGADLGQWLSQLFQVLNTQVPERQKTLDEDLAKFPYINGTLFKQTLYTPSFNTTMRKALLDVCYFDWSKISPAIFGSLFQSVMNPVERRSLGAHYTTEQNILKVIEPLFMDELHDEFLQLKYRRDNRKLHDLMLFQSKLGSLNFFDPACGCGNFLIIAYRELRLLEMDVIREIRKQKDLFDAKSLSQVDVDQFSGVEISEFPARIAEAAMWMMDHMMNNRLSLDFGRTYIRIPLVKTPKIIVGNALHIDWNTILPTDERVYIFGNPPFIGHQLRTKEQQEDMAIIWGRKGQVNRLDYVTCWIKLAAQYSMDYRSTGIAFVATNSITQGEQCGILWPVIFSYSVKIRFAHRTFQWNSEARGKAAVHCVIVGMATESENRECYIFDYEDVKGEPRVSPVARINGYLFEGPQYEVPARSSPPTGWLSTIKGSQPTDGSRTKQSDGGYVTNSNLILDDNERRQLIAEDSKCEKWLRPYVGAKDLISGKWRWCLWLKNVEPSELRSTRSVVERLKRIREARLQSPTESVRKYAKYPSLFTQDRQPETDYLVIPQVSSETRDYIPIDILSPDVIASNTVQIIPNAPLYYFGILASAMHMAWVRAVAGRLKNDLRYSPAVYNSFPWPQLSVSQKNRLEKLSTCVLDTRKGFSNASLATLYDPEVMPPPLREAHNLLDKEVDKLYRRKRFASERERIEYLFDVYVSKNLLKPSETTKRKRKRVKKS